MFRASVLLLLPALAPLTASGAGKSPDALFRVRPPPSLVEWLPVEGGRGALEEDARDGVRALLVDLQTRVHPVHGVKR